jgi:hypothetical protein
MGVPVADRKPLNAVKYAAKDYASIFDSLLRRLKVEYATIYNDYASTAVGIMLIDLMANAVGQLCWYMDRVASDCYLDTARTHSAVAKLVKQIGYKMRPASAATVDLALTFTPAIPAPAQLQAGFRFGGPSGLIFETVAPTFLAPGTATITVACREGASRTVGYTGDGAQNQRFRMQGGDPANGVWVAQGSVRVWIDGAEWAEHDFLDFTPTNQYEVDYLYDPPAVACGDGVAGNIPEAGADVKIQYTLIHGATGRAAAGTVTSVIDVLSVGGAAIKIACTNPLGASGGADPESPDEARKLAPYAFAARGAAITQTDYQAQVNGFSDPLYGRVAKGYAINVRASAEDAILVGECEQIDGYLANYVLLVGPAEAEAAADIATAQDLLAEMQALLAEMGSLRSALEVQAANVRVVAQQLQVEMTTGNAAYQAMGTTLTSLDNYIRTTYPSDTTLANYSRTLAAQGGTISTSLSNGGSAATKLDGYGFTLQQLLTPTGTGQATLAQYLATLTALVNSTTVTVGNAADAIAPLPGSAAQLQADILAVVVDLQAHLSTLFDADCKANYVQVPIVSVNGDGDYVAPAAGLIYGLQAYLDGIKEVTQLVQVTDGSAMLVPVDVAVAVKVVPSYVAAEVLADIEQALLEVLRGRDFAQPLYKQFVHDTIKAATKGMDYANVTLAAPGHEGFVDVDGNVMTPASYIITRGTLALSEIK